MENNTIRVLEPVHYEQGSVSIVHKSSFKRVKRQKRAKQAAEGGSSQLLDLLIKQCVICLALLAVLTVINIIGISQVYSGVVKIIESSSITEYFYAVKSV